MSRRRDAVPDDARPPPRSPNAPRRLSTPRRQALGNRSGPGMTLAAAAPTTNGSESLATDIHIRDRGSFSCARSGRRTRRASAGGQGARHRQTPDGRSGGPLAHQLPEEAQLTYRAWASDRHSSRRKLRCGAEALDRNPLLTNAPLRKAGDNAEHDWLHQRRYACPHGSGGLRRNLQPVLSLSKEPLGPGGGRGAQAEPPRTRTAGRRRRLEPTGDGKEEEKEKQEEGQDRAGGRRIRTGP